MLRSMTLRILACTATLLSVPTMAEGGIRYWREADGGNGHGYEVVMFRKNDIPSTWDRARILARKRGGYLATVTSEAENAFILKLINKRKYWYYLRDGFQEMDFWDGPWIGGYQIPGSKEPAGGWRWVTRERFRYDDWHSTTPDDLFGGFTQQNRLHYWDQGTVKKFKDLDPKWDDVHEGTNWIPAFVVEYEPKPPRRGALRWSSPKAKPSVFFSR